MSRKPNEQQIAQMLSELPPEPSENFHRRMANAPWNQPEMKKSAWLPRQLLTLAAALLLVTSLVLLTPLRSLAQDIWQGFFSHQSDDNWSTVYRPDLSPTATIAPEVIQATLQAPLPEIAEVEAQVGFHILAPTYLPPGYTLRDIYVSDGQYTPDATSSVTLSYSLEDDQKLHRNLAIRQSLSDAQSSAPVGASADVHNVQVGDATGQYVQGGWQTVGVIEDNEQNYIDSEWSNDIEIHRLIWQADGFTFEIFFQAAFIPHPAYYEGGAHDQPGYLTIDNLIAIAESLQ